MTLERGGPDDVALPGHGKGSYFIPNMNGSH